MIIAIAPIHQLVLVVPDELARVVFVGRKGVQARAGSKMVLVTPDVTGKTPAPLPQARGRGKGNSDLKQQRPAKALPVRHVSLWPSSIPVPTRGH